MRPLRFVVALLGVAGCAADAGLDARASSIAIAGRWQPAESTRSIAATQHVPVVDPPAVAPLGSCRSTNPFACSCTHPACTPALPGTRELNTFLLRRYPFLRAGGTYCCRQNSATTRVPMLSVHATGRAIDLMVPMAGGDADNTLGDAAANWLVENAEFIGIQRVIWDRSYWNGERGFGALSDASLPHTDHLHVELSTRGAARLTPFFSGASAGTPCAPRCDDTRAIQADCSYTDCAATGAACVAGTPPRCGTPPPPESPEATAVPGAALPSVTTIAAPSRFTFLTPRRAFDTRTPASSASLARSGGGGALNASSNGVYRSFASVGVPGGSAGVWLNVAAIGTASAGFVTVFSEGQPRPPTSTVNFVAGQALANATPVALGARQGVVFEANTDAHVIADVSGAFTPTGSGLTPVVPQRVLDTRSDLPLVSNTVRAIDVTAPAGSLGVTATVAVIAGPAAGFLTVFPCGTAIPESSNVNFAANAVVSNAVVTALGSGQICLLSNVEAHVVVDITGYLGPSGLSYTALSPQRVLDTRQPTSIFTGRLAARQVIEVPLQRLPGMPASVGAVVANLTVVDASDAGFVTAYPCGSPTPPTSSLNFPAQSAVGTLTLSALHAGSLCLFASTRTHLIVDLLGVWTGSASTPPPPTDPGDIGDDPEPDAGVAMPDASATRPDAGTTPPDITVSPADAGRDAATPQRDNGALPDASPTRDDTTVTSNGCGCRATTDRAPPTAVSIALLSLLLLRRRRVKARRLDGPPAQRRSARTRGDPLGAARVGPPVSRSLSIAALVVSALLAGCSKMPDATAASRAYDAHRATIDDVAARIRVAARALPQTSVVRCEDARDVVRANLPARYAEFEACTARRRAWIERENTAWQSFRWTGPLAALDAHPDLLGISVSVTSRGEAARYSVDVGATSPSRVGVTAAQGLHRGDRSVGYHQYQTAFAFTRPGGAEVRVGDGDHRPGVEVVWTFTEGDALVRVALVTLIDGATTAPWRAAHREVLSR